ncbi:MAG: ATP-binding protein [Clostridia bacterium]|nr:ATP-binding protein [Clostridia bacterium]
MDRIVSKMIIYTDMPKDSILEELCEICREIDKKRDIDRASLTKKVYKQIRKLLVLATNYGFNKNLWHDYLTFMLVMDENPFSLTCEMMGSGEGSVNAFAKNDFTAIKALFDYDFSYIEEKLEIDCFSTITNYTAIKKPELLYNKYVSEKVRALSDKIANAKDGEEVFELVTSFYREYGVGTFGMNKAFRIERDKKGELVFLPINNMDKVVLDDLVGYESQKKKLIDNTRAFVEGKKANNVLLYGDSGTGKSTSVKAIANEYYEKGLRLIEIYKHQFKDLSSVIAQIKNRNYRFIIFLDDLSFEEFETDYKFLKAVIEGGVETKPENVLIYATSNRRNLIRETWKDRDDIMTDDDDVHHMDTMEEKLSLAHRFGVTINYSKPSRREYFEIVKELAKRNSIEQEWETLEKEASIWEMYHGGTAPRCAQQFINHKLGEK